MGLYEHCMGGHLLYRVAANLRCPRNNLVVGNRYVEMNPDFLGFGFCRGLRRHFLNVGRRKFVVNTILALA
jgi:hypothetical protein